MSNRVVRWINYALLVVILLYPFASGFSVSKYIDDSSIFMLVLFPNVIASYSVGIASRKHFGDEDDKEERHRFEMDYATLCTMLSTLLLLSIEVSSKMLSGYNVGLAEYVIAIVPVVILAINVTNITGLYGLGT